MNNPIIILGAGYGGLCAAFELAKRKKKLDGREIILIDRNEHFLYTPLLYEVATGFEASEIKKMPERQVEERLLEGATLSYDRLETMFSKKGIKFLDGDATGIDFEKQEVTISDAQKISWSYLVIAIGGETDYYGIPGLKEHSYQLKNLRHALAIRRKLCHALLKKERGEEAHVSVVVGGAGATGVETTAELVRFFEKMIGSGVVSRGDITITLVEAGSKALAAFDPRFTKWAEDRLERWGVKIYRDTCIQSVEDGKVILAPRPLKEGENMESLVCEFRTEKFREINADVLIWTGGIRAPAFLAQTGLPCDRRGRVEINLKCQVRDRNKVYAIGDCSILINPKTNQPVPSLAQSAMKEAHLAAENIIAEISGGQLKEYSFPFLHTLVPLGGKYALANVFGFKFKGILAWVVRQAADFRYFAHILPFWKAIRVWLHGVRVYSKND